MFLQYIITSNDHILYQVCYVLQDVTGILISLNRWKHPVSKAGAFGPAPCRPGFQSLIRWLREIARSKIDSHLCQIPCWTTRKLQVFVTRNPDAFMRICSLNSGSKFDNGFTTLYVLDIPKLAVDFKVHYGKRQRHHIIRTFMNQAFSKLFSEEPGLINHSKIGVVVRIPLKWKTIWYVSAIMKVSNISIWEGLFIVIHYDFILFGHVLPSLKLT